jgi:hypothetical protein
MFAMSKMIATIGLLLSRFILTKARFWIILVPQEGRLPSPLSYSRSLLIKSISDLTRFRIVVIKIKVLRVLS